MKLDIYVHANRETSWDRAIQVGLTGEAARKASFLGYEHKLTYEVDPETGDGTLIAVDDREIQREEK